MLNMNLQFFAHKKGVGSTKIGRDSESKRLGANRADGQFVKAGNFFFCLCVFLFFGFVVFWFFLFLLGFFSHFFFIL